MSACYQKAADMPDPSLSSADQLHDDLARAGSIRASALVDAALGLVTSFANISVRGVDGVSITLERHGRMVTVAGSDDTVRLMDQHQYATGEGPCLAAASEGRSFVSPSLLEEERWPAFVPRAVEQGIVSILSTPLLVSMDPVGAINMYSCTSEVFGRGEQDVATYFAKRAARILGAAAEVDEDQGVRISAALTSRDIIAMAQGVHMSRLGISAEAAAAELYRAARAKDITVRAEAIAVVGSTGTDDGGPGGHDGR